MLNQNQAPIFGASIMSIHRPAWTQDDLHAFNHCFRVKRIDRNFFLRTKGFAKKEDLAVVNSIQPRQSKQPAKSEAKKLKFFG